MGKAEIDQIKSDLRRACDLLDRAGTSPSARRAAVREALGAAITLVGRELAEAELVRPLLELSAALDDLDSGRCDTVVQPEMTGTKAPSALNECDHALAAALVDQLATSRGLPIGEAVRSLSLKLGVPGTTLLSWRKKARSGRYGAAVRAGYFDMLRKLEQAEITAIESVTDDLARQLRR